MTTITFKTDGTAQHVGENSLLAGSVARATKRRASHVEPQNLILRVLFRIIRARADDESTLAKWTRTWPCLWRVKIVDGPVLPKLYTDRAEAIADEIQWLERNRL